MIILGVNYGHDSSACLLVDGEIVANVQEERFTRIKHDSSFPLYSIKYCLETANIESEQIDIVTVPYENGNPRLHHYFNFSDEQLQQSFVESLPRKYFRKKLFRDNISLPLFIDKFQLNNTCRIQRVNHHLSHAASAYLTSGRIDKTLLFVIDGLGDGKSVSIYEAENRQIRLLDSFDRTGSIGWFYSNVTEALGWAHGDGEGTTMGLAPYGTDQQKNQFSHFFPAYKNGKLVSPHNFGKMYAYNKNESTMFHFEESRQIKELVDKLGREDSAACAQSILEENVQDIVYSWIDKTGIKDISCAGGVFLNVKLNQRLWCSGKLDSQHIYPDPGDSGLAVGSALYAFSQQRPQHAFSKIKDLYHGPAFSNEEMEKMLILRKLKYTKVSDASLEAAKLLSKNKIVGWFQDRMEAGPRALGNRSILMSPINAENKDIINSQVKFRQGFRPFCPSVLSDAFDDYFVNARDEEYMITSFEFKKEKRDKVPAVVHADGTGRPQKVKQEINDKYYRLIKHFGELTGEYLVLNTSFNIKGEPMICHPKEAIRCFFDNGLDALFLGDYLLVK